MVPLSELQRSCRFDDVSPPSTSSTLLGRQISSLSSPLLPRQLSRSPFKYTTAPAWEFSTRTKSLENRELGEGRKFVSPTLNDIVLGEMLILPNALSKLLIQQRLACNTCKLFLTHPRTSYHILIDHSLPTRYFSFRHIDCAS